MRERESSELHPESRAKIEHFSAGNITTSYKSRITNSDFCVGEAHTKTRGLQ